MQEDGDLVVDRAVEIHAEIVVARRAEPDVLAVVGQAEDRRVHDERSVDRDLAHLDLTTLDARREPHAGEREFPRQSVRAQRRL